jgi:protein arginine kinase activator
MVHMPNKFDISGNPPEETPPERPLECSDCKKPISTCYSEIVGNTISCNCMCSDCPVLERRLFGLRDPNTTEQITEGATGLACGNCGTTLEALRVGAPLGCSSCYEVFEEMIITELFTLDKVPAWLGTAKKTQSLHIGRGPGQTQEISASMRILALNEALNETLKREDYEQAAWLRDQIKALTDDQEADKERTDGG